MHQGFDCMKVNMATFVQQVGICPRRDVGFAAGNVCLLMSFAGDIFTSQQRKQLVEIYANATNVEALDYSLDDLAGALLLIL
jgi:hypothetical protein